MQLLTFSSLFPKPSNTQALCLTELLSKNDRVQQSHHQTPPDLRVRDEFVMTVSDRRRFKLHSFNQHFGWKWLNWSSPGRSCWCKSDVGVCAVSESGRQRQESAAGRIQRKQELGEGVGWLLKWRAWRHGGWADVALQTAELTSWWLLSNVLFSIFFCFSPFMNRLMVYSSSKYPQKQSELRKIPTKIMLRMVS